MSVRDLTKPVLSTANTANTNLASQTPEVKIVRVSERGRAEALLPPADTKRWVMRRKAQLVQSVKAGLISLEDACARYGISEEEFRSWQKLIDAHGVRGLRTTRLQDYRSTARIQGVAE